MTNRTMPAEEYTDSELVSRCLAGDRDAFSRIVTRYQILICSLAYSRLGNLGQSEDVAQETFITAWKHLRLLREPEKLRSWLCGIVRNRIHKHVRRETREPAHNAASLESVPDAPASEALPSEQTIGREEEAILWRSLEKIPELYREPLILFYREHQSVEQVAAELELSEDAVKQRLARGRKLLQEEVQTFVETTLRRTAPGRAFSGAVLAALPMVPAATVGVGAVGKGSAAAKSGFLGAWLVPLAPFIGIFAGLMSQLMLVRATTTGRERRARTILLLIICVLLPASAVIGENAVGYLSQRFGWSGRIYFVVKTFFWWSYAIGLSAWLTRIIRKMQALRDAVVATGGIPKSDTMNLTPGTRVMVVVGMSLMLYAWLISLTYQAHDPVTTCIITGIMVVQGVWNFFSARGWAAPATAQVTGWQLLFYLALILAVLNIRLDVWMATARGVSLPQIHALYPLWLIPSLSLALLAWIGFVWAVTKPKCHQPLPTD